MYQLSHPCGFGHHKKMASPIKQAFKQHIETSFHGGLFGTKTVTTIRKKKIHKKG
jgi:hypothetical protein